MIDWFPFDNQIYLSGGFLYNTNKIEGNGTPLKTYTIGAKIYTPEKLGRLFATVEPKIKVSPYLGFGWGNSVKAGKGLGFRFDAGMIYQGAPDVTLQANGLIEPTAEQEPDVENDLRNLKYYPVLSFGLTYKF